MGNIFSWLNEPATFSGNADGLSLTTREKPISGSGRFTVSSVTMAMPT